MKKFIIGFVLFLSLGGNTPISAQTENGDSGKTFDEILSEWESETQYSESIDSARQGVEHVREDVRNTGKLGEEIIGIERDTIQGVIGVVEEVEGLIEDTKELEDIWDNVFGEGKKEDTGALPSGEFELPNASEFNKIGENTSFRDYVLNVINFFLTFLGLLAVSAIIYAGYLYVASFGDDSNTEKSKKIVLYAVVGILLILASFAIVNTLITKAGKGERDNGSSSGRASSGDFVITDGSSLIKRTVNLNIRVLNGVKIGLNKVIVDLETAREEGVIFSLGQSGVALFDFGNGRLIPGNAVENFIQRFGEEKTYRIRSAVKTPNGSLLKGIVYLIIGKLDPIIGFPEKIVTGQKVTLDGSKSSAPKGEAKILNYKWTCSGGRGCFKKISGETVEVAFQEPGNYIVKLEIVTDINGFDASATQDISVESSTEVSNEEEVSEFDGSNDPTNSQTQSGGASKLQNETSELPAVDSGDQNGGSETNNEGEDSNSETEANFGATQN